MVYPIGRTINRALTEVLPAAFNGLAQAAGRVPAVQAVANALRGPVLGALRFGESAYGNLPQPVQNAMNPVRQVMEPLGEQALTNLGLLGAPAPPTPIMTSPMPAAGVFNGINTLAQLGLLPAAQPVLHAAQAVGQTMYPNAAPPPAAGWSPTPTQVGGPSPMRQVNAPVLPLPGEPAFVGPVRPSDAALQVAGYAPTGAPITPQFSAPFTTDEAESLRNRTAANTPAAATPAATGAVMPPASGTGGGTGSAARPSNVDPVWWEQFKREHGGVDPTTFYKGDLAAALEDKAWGDQFFRMYGRAPSEYDWKASYNQREYGGGGGGGYGGYSGGSAAAAGTSPLWQAIFGNYYSTRPGENSANDYNNFIRSWTNAAGRVPTMDEASRILTGYQNYLVNNGTGGAIPDFNTYLGRVLNQGQTPPPIAYLNTGEI
jgi:hypothetical protein